MKNIEKFYILLYIQLKLMNEITHNSKQFMHIVHHANSKG